MFQHHSTGITGLVNHFVNCTGCGLDKPGKTLIMGVS